MDKPACDISSQSSTCRLEADVHAQAAMCKSIGFSVPLMVLIRKPYMRVSKSSGLLLGVPMIRIIVYWGLCGGPLFMAVYGTPTNRTPREPYKNNGFGS